MAEVDCLVVEAGGGEDAVTKTIESAGRRKQEGRGSPVN